MPCSAGSKKRGGNGFWTAPVSHGDATGVRVPSSVIQVRTEGLLLRRGVVVLLSAPFVQGTFVQPPVPGRFYECNDVNQLNRGLRVSTPCPGTTLMKHVTSEKLVWSIPTCVSLCTIFYFFIALQLAPPAFRLHHFWLFLFVCAVLVLLCFLAWMRTAILAGGIAVVRSGFCVIF